MWHANLKLHNETNKETYQIIWTTTIRCYSFILLFFCNGRNCMNIHKQDFYFLFQLDCFFMNISFNLIFFLHERCINDGNMICLKLPTLWPLSKIVYMCSSLLHLAVESRDLSQAQKKVTVIKPEKIHNIKSFSLKILSKNSCHSLNFFIFGNSYFLTFPACF